MFTFYNEYDEDIMKIDVMKNTTCYGALTATNISSTNKTDIEALQTKTQNINVDGTTLSNITTINGYKFREGGTFMYSEEAPYIPVCESNGTFDIGLQLDFHYAGTDENYRARLTCKGTNILELEGASSYMIMNRLNIGMGLALISGNTLMRFMKSDASTIMLSLNADTNEATFLGNIVAPNITSLSDNALAAFTRTTGMTHTVATTEPVAPANTSFAHNISSVECYSGRYHTNSTSSLPINSVASVSTWGAIRIVRTGLAKDAKCGYQFGRGNDSTTLSSPTYLSMQTSYNTSLTTMDL